MCVLAGQIWISGSSPSFYPTFFQYIPNWLAPNVLTLATFLLSLLQYVFLAYYDYSLISSSIEAVHVDHIPHWIWLFSAFVLLAAIALGTKTRLV
jgi:hypothetical protein